MYVGIRGCKKCELTKSKSGLVYLTRTRFLHPLGFVSF